MTSRRTEPVRAPRPNRQLVAARYRLNLTQAELAERIRVKAAELNLNLACDEKRVGRWERGEVRVPSPAYRRVLCAVFGIDNVRELGFVLPINPTREQSTGSDSRGETEPNREGDPEPVELISVAESDALSSSAYTEGRAEGYVEGLTAGRAGGAVEARSPCGDSVDRDSAGPCQAYRRPAGCGGRWTGGRGPWRIGTP